MSRAPAGITAGEVERLADEVKAANRANKEFEEAAKKAVRTRTRFLERSFPIFVGEMGAGVRTTLPEDALAHGRARVY